VKLLTKVRHTHYVHWLGWVTWVGLGRVSVDDVLGWVGLGWNKWTHVHLWQGGYGLRLTQWVRLSFPHDGQVRCYEVMRRSLSQYIKVIALAKPEKPAEWLLLDGVWNLDVLLSASINRCAHWLRLQTASAVYVAAAADVSSPVMSASRNLLYARTRIFEILVVLSPACVCHALSI